jgi:hypothetical protein
MPPKRSPVNRAAPALSQPTEQPETAATKKELRLPPFKEAAPRAWFKQAEAYFRIHGETDRELWYFYVTWALSPQQEALVQDITEAEVTPPNAYELLKERLLQLHEKSERARAKKLLLHMAPIGGRRPSELLAEMSSLCPKGEQGSNLMRYLFFFRLPPRIQELLGEDDHSSIVELAARADKLTRDEADKAEPIGAVEESTVAAAGPPPTSSRKRKWPAKKGGKKGGDGGGADTDAWKSTDMCYAHFTYGSKARHCKPPCSRAGN